MAEENGRLTEVLSREEKMAVQCPMCEASVGAVCRIRNIGIGLVGHKPLVSLNGREVFHSQRIVKAQQVKINTVVPRTLSATDKSIIVYYAFVQLSESCSSKSLELFGKHFKPEEIQKFFAQTAITELRKDGLLR